MRNLILLCLITFLSCSEKINDDKDLIESLMLSQPANFGSIHADWDKYEVQIIYSRISRDSANIPSFKTYFYNHQPDQYFYPASTVKLPASILALEKLNALEIKGLTMETAMLTDSAWAGQTSVLNDSTSSNLLPSVGHYIKKILLVSDNDAFNRLYEFLGQRPFNEAMWEKGYTHSRFTHRLSIFLPPEQNAVTNPIRFLNGDSLVYSQPLMRNSTPIKSAEPIWLGEKHYTMGELVDSPMDFQFKNAYPLLEQHAFLKTLFFPETADDPFNLTEKDYAFIYKYMSLWPSETSFPDYSEHVDHYVKFFMYGAGKTPISKNVRIFNKVGQAYGYLIDNAYIVDFEENIEFLVSAVIYVNENQTLNDGIYEYDATGFPFFESLGQLFYTYEKEHPHIIAPDLSRLKKMISK